VFTKVKVTRVKNITQSQIDKYTKKFNKMWSKECKLWEKLILYSIFSFNLKLLLLLFNVLFLIFNNKKKIV